MQFEFQKQKSREASAEESEHREFRKGVFGRLDGSSKNA